jgi:signal transduction histidine kinase
MTVSDKGPGISEGDRSRLFGRFVRGAERSPDEGSGLGLYVSRELCRAMGGDLVLEPTSGPGASFSIHLAAESADEG